jgi:ATP-dependent DNA helicase RecQ
MRYNSSRSLQLLSLGTGIPNVRFREGQEQAIQHIVEGRGRLLVVQKTGWGKSLVYFIACKLLRENGAGPCLLVSPLLALMRNQIAAATRMGVNAYTINSDNQDQWEEIETRIGRNEVDVLVVSPERLANERFRSAVLSIISSRISLLVIDEAHCISDWGHDFRPHYRLLERIVRTLPSNLRLLATTATANNRVLKDLSEVLGPRLTTLRGNLNRPSLCLQTIRLPNQAQRLAWLAEQVPQLEGSGIIYTLTVRDANQVADWLKTRGIDVEAYTGETGELRSDLEQRLLDNRVKALVATTALGMGFDKPDLAFVIHYQTPGSVVAYYQQVGRAGRALEVARGILLSGEEETDINTYFIESAFPTRDEVKQVLEALHSEVQALSVSEIMAKVNLSKGRIEKTISLLSLESPSPIIKSGTKLHLTATRLSEAFWQRAQRLTELRHSEQQEMQQYVRLESDHMNFLIRALDGEPCKPSPSRLLPLTKTVNSTIVQEAYEFLRRSSLPIEPRKKWPTGGLPQYKLKGNIPSELQAQAGRALCVWRDSGWGDLVKNGKYEVGQFSDDLVDACVKLIDSWKPQPKPEWVTCIPSLRHPKLVPDFARRMSAKLELPFLEVLTKTTERPEQKTMANSTQQARNIDGSLAIMQKFLPAGSVFLIDDMVDSRWTLTVGAWLLRKNGSGPVFLLALASTSRG